MKYEIGRVNPGPIQQIPNPLSIEHVVRRFPKPQPPHIVPIGKRPPIPMQIPKKLTDMPRIRGVIKPRIPNSPYIVSKKVIAPVKPTPKVKEIPKRMRIIPAERPQNMMGPKGANTDNYGNTYRYEKNSPSQMVIVRTPTKTIITPRPVSWSGTGPGPTLIKPVNKKTLERAQMCC